MQQANLDDPYNLQRFVEAQAPIYDQVLAELRAGSKRTHWMWFIFPQISGLGSSPMAIRYALSSKQEAAAYLNHPILGPRLRECTHLVTQVEGRSIDQIFGYPDDLKFRSSMTLFTHATPDNQVFLDALQKYFDGKFDPATLRQLESTKSAAPAP
jgi:uncharacterized protein (DUF1810 family)